MSEKEDVDWVTKKVSEFSEKKQKAWMRWMKSPDDTSLRAQYQQFKIHSRKVADKAHAVSDESLSCEPNEDEIWAAIKKSSTRMEA